MTKKKPATGAELMARLNADPDFVAKRQKEEDERQARAKKWREAEAPLVAELRAAGFRVESAWDLVNTARPYPEALPILVEHLQKPYPARVREGIARALAVPQAKFAWDVFASLYRDEESGDAKDGLAVALAAAADDDVLEDVIALLRESRNGPSRVLLLSVLEESPDPRTRAALMELGTESDLESEIQAILRRQRNRNR